MHLLRSTQTSYGINKKYVSKDETDYKIKLNA
jgi:hypothetical protein